VFLRFRYQETDITCLSTASIAFLLSQRRERQKANNCCYAVPVIVDVMWAAAPLVISISQFLIYFSIV
jgi:hypothetical protein